MMHVVVCGSIELSDGNFQDELDACVKRRTGEQLHVENFDNPLEAVEYIEDPPVDEPVDLVFCTEDMPGISGIDLLQELHDSGQTARVVLFADDEGQAYEALVLHVGGYLVSPASKSSFEKVLDRLVADIVDRHANSVVLPCREGTRRIDFGDFVFSETASHDQVIHLKDGSTCSLRSSPSALYSQVENDDRFFKMGSSYIVNLSHVRKVRSGGSTVHVTGGQELNVPVRLRKPLARALLPSE